MLQEALNNVQKYSQADKVEISLTKRDSSVIFRLRDNGQGFDIREANSRKETGKGFGLGSMKERVELSGGRFELHSDPGLGVLIKAEWKID